MAPLQNNLSYMEYQSSSLPALVFSGDWNSYIPPAWVKANIKSLSGAKLVEIPNTGWTLLQGDCLVPLASGFFQNPRAGLDTSCVKKIPEVQFNLPME